MSKYTTYNVIVQAYNSRGSGPSSQPVTARTLEDAPTLPPENVQCSVQSAQSLHVSWEPPLLEGRNGDIKGYKVTHHSVSEWLGKNINSIICNSRNTIASYFILFLLIIFTDKDDQQTKITSMQRTTIGGLHKYTNYSITVLAYTTRGDGVRSEPIFCHTDEDGKFNIFYI